MHSACFELASDSDVEDLDWSSSGALLETPNMANVAGLIVADLLQDAALALTTSGSP